MQATPSFDVPLAPPWEPSGFSNARNLDEFYVAAAGGWDFETGEVVDRDLDRATYRDYTAYRRAPWHAAHPALVSAPMETIPHD